MKFVADEGIDALVVIRLREAGYSVKYVAEMAAGISDPGKKSEFDHIYINGRFPPHTIYDS